MSFRLILALALATLALASFAQETPAQKAKRMKWWKEARFGMFIHWGLYAIPAGKWGNATGHGEWIRETAQIPVTEYEKFKSQFNPVKFNADEWARLAKNAGMKYVVITSKHHDGFALYDSKLTDWDVMDSPFKRDILKELSTAVRKQGLTMCWYHSIMDWHHPDYLPRRSWEAANRPATGADFDRFVKYLHGQVTELLTNYGPIGVMWFDGEWESTWNHGYGQPLYDLCRKLQPNVIVNNRVDVGRGGMAGMSDAGFAGDYGTPEQEVPATGIPGVDWETCMTMNDHWGYNERDKNHKSTKQIIHLLCDIVSKGGNYLLNVGPTAEGLIPPESVQRLNEIGAWMKVNGGAIYGTSASPFKSLPWGRCTMKSTGTNTSLYLHVFDWPSGRLTVPGLGNDVVSARLMNGKKLTVSRSGSDVVIAVPAKAPDANASVIELKIKGTPIVYEAPQIVAESPVFVKPMAVKMSASKGMEIRYTTNGTNPTASSALYSKPLTLSQSATVKARGFHKGKAVTPVTAATFDKVSPWPAVRTRNMNPGIAVGIYPGEFSTMPVFEALRPESQKTLEGFTLADDPKRENVARLYRAWVSVSEDDVYKFALRSDDGSRLWIDGQLIVDNDGLHSPAEKTGVVPLSKGWHHIRVEWFNRTGGADLDVRMAQLGGDLMPISKSMLMRQGT